MYINWKVNWALQIHLHLLFPTTIHKCGSRNTFLLSSFVFNWHILEFYIILLHLIKMTNNNQIKNLRLVWSNNPESRLKQLNSFQHQNFYERAANFVNNPILKWSDNKFSSMTINDKGRFSASVEIICILCILYCNVCT